VQIREESGFREATRDDEDSLIEWLAAEICPVVLNDDDGVRAALLARCRKLSIEPAGRLERILGGARSRFDKGFCAEVVDRLSAESIDRLEELVTGVDLQWNRYVGDVGVVLGTGSWGPLACVPVRSQSACDLA
jgi:hypothetical protein